MSPKQVAAHWEANAETWTRLSRAGYDVYRDAHNTPAFLAILPSIQGLKGLDIGCGEGSNTRLLAERGAAMEGIDVARTFVDHAQAAEALDPRGITYRKGDALALPFGDSSFDFATAFMVMMDVPDPGLAVREAARVLRPGGFLQFSILHPCFVPPYRKTLREPDGTVRAIEIAGYFDNIDGRIDEWIFSNVPVRERQNYRPFQVPRFHRTLTQWVEMIRAAGLILEAFGEPQATEEEAAGEPIIADTRVAPLFLHVRGRKPTV